MGARKNTDATGGLKGTAAEKVLRNIRTPKIKAKCTERIIKSAYRANSGHCALSDAVKAAAPWAQHIASDLQSIRVTDPRHGLRYTYLTPRTAQVALLAFDQGKIPPPFDFTLRGGHVATSYKRTVLPDGTKKVRPVVKLGRRRLVTGGNEAKGDVPGTIGGKAGVPTPGPLSAGSHARGRNTGNPGYRREFGMRAFTGAFRLEDLEEVQIPVGAPSVSSK